jgi:hypothetical protein
VAIDDSEVAKSGAKFDPEPFARIMRPRPSRSIAEFVRRRFEPPKVIEVLAAWALIGSRVELEKDLVASVGDIEDETAPLSTMRAADRTVGQTQVEQRLRPGIDPLR